MTTGVKDENWISIKLPGTSNGKLNKYLLSVKELTEGIHFTQYFIRKKHCLEKPAKSNYILKLN